MLSVTKQLVRKCISLWCVEETRNSDQVQQLAEKLLWLTHATRLCTHVDSGKQALMGLINFREFHSLNSFWNFLNLSLFMCHRLNPCWKSWEINQVFKPILILNNIWELLRIILFKPIFQFLLGWQTFLLNYFYKIDNLSRY